MVEKDREENELVEYSYNLNDGNYIEKIYYDFETKKAVKFGRNIDEKVLWIPKSNIRGGWSRDKKIPQNIKVKYPMELYWQKPKNIYLEI